MKFQLVLQWPACSLKNSDEAVEIEDLLIGNVDQQDAVDGHDFGSGEANIFVLTNEPHRTFEDIRTILASHRLWESALVAFRRTDGNEYTVLWPKGSKTFSVR